MQDALTSMGLDAVDGAKRLAGRSIDRHDLGARTALTRGNAFIRKVFLLVVGALAIKLAWDTFFTYWG